MLKEIVTSRVLYKLIQYYCYSHVWLHTREIARFIKEDASNTSVALKRLEKSGIVQSRITGNKLEYKSVQSEKLEALRLLMQDS